MKLRGAVGSLPLAFVKALLRLPPPIMTLRGCSLCQRWRVGVGPGDRRYAGQVHTHTHTHTHTHCGSEHNSQNQEESSDMEAAFVGKMSLDG